MHPDGSLAHDPRKWWALAVLLLAQVMIILDIAIVNVALPSAQAELHIARSDVQWIVTSYLLPFGGLLLLGGRVADYAGRKRIFVVATVGFAGASAAGGLAQAAGVLFAARAAQGLFAAAMAPSLLSMLTLGFPDGHDRTRAFALFGGVSAAGGAVGLVLGGLLTEYLSWRWSLLINVPLALLVAVAASGLLRDSRAPGPRRYDVAGAILGTVALLGIIYGIATAADHGWGATATVLSLAAGTSMLAIFAAWEASTSHPLMPLALVRDRTRVGGFLSFFVVYGPPTGMTLLVLIFLQGPRHEPALTAGLHFLPVPAFAVVGALCSMRLLETMSPRTLVAAGSLVATAGMAAFVRVGLDARFVQDIVPGLALTGLGASIVFIASNAMVLRDVPEGDTGVASGVINTIQQVGAAVGVAVLSTVAAQSTSAYLASHGRAGAGQAVVHGNQTAFVVAAVLMLAVGVVAAALIEPGAARDARRGARRKASATPRRSAPRAAAPPLRPPPR